MSEYYDEHIKQKEEDAMTKCFKILRHLLNEQDEYIPRHERRAKLNILVRQFFRYQLGFTNVRYLFNLSDYDWCLKYLTSKCLEDKAVHKFKMDMGYEVNTLLEVRNLLELIPKHKDVLESLEKEIEELFK